MRIVFILTLLILFDVIHLNIIILSRPVERILRYDILENATVSF
jgi:hypothetical protein